MITVKKRSTLPQNRNKVTMKWIDNDASPPAQIAFSAEGHKTSIHVIIFIVVVVMHIIFVYGKIL